MKITIAAMYWLIVFGCFFFLFCILPALHFSLNAVGVPFMVSSYQDVNFGGKELANYITVVLWIVTSLIVHFLLIKRNTIAWFVAFVWYLISVIVSLPLLFQQNIWEMPNYDVPWFWFVFNGLLFLSLFMTYYTFAVLIVDRRQFFGRYH